MDRRWLRLGCVLGILVMTCWIPGTVTAEPGEGLKTEAFVLSPSLTVTGAYDSNVFRQGGNEPRTADGSPLVAPILTVKPAFDLKTRDSLDLEFSLNGSVEYDEYIAPDSPQVNSQGGFSGSGGTALTLNPDGAVSFNVHDDINYRAVPPNQPSRFRQARLFNRAGASVGLHPGDDTLRFDAGYDFEIFRYYEDNRLANLDKNQHIFSLRGEYKFLPKTAFVARGNWGIINYEQQDRINEIPNIDSMPLRIRGGISGLITRRFTTQLLAGYGHAMYEREDDFQGFIGAFQFGYRLGALGDKNRDRIFLRYQRGFEDSTVSNYFAYHRGTLGYDQGFFDNRLELKLEATVSFEDYSTILADQATQNGNTTNLPGDLEDVNVLGRAGLTFNATKWLAFTGSYEYDQNITETNFEYPAAPFDPTREYMRHYFSLSARAHY